MHNGPKTRGQKLLTSFISRNLMPAYKQRAEGSLATWPNTVSTYTSARQRALRHATTQCQQQRAQAGAAHFEENSTNGTRIVTWSPKSFSGLAKAPARYFPPQPLLAGLNSISAQGNRTDPGQKKGGKKNLHGRGSIHAPDCAPTERANFAKN